MILAFVLGLAHAALPPQYEGTADFSNCSGFLVTTETRALTEKALVATNGHCWQTLLGSMVLSPGELRQDRALKRSLSLVNDQGLKLKFTSSRLLLATMTGTDLAVYELTESYQELAQKGIGPFVVSTPVLGDEVEVISAHKNNTHTCQIEAISNTREGGYDFTDSLRLSRDCKQGNGTSGSPVVRAGTREVIGIANSFNKNGKKCTNNNPCEVSGETVTVHFGARYAQRLELLVKLLQEVP
jgi:hypothetical protein